MTDDLKHFHVSTVWEMARDKVWAGIFFVLFAVALAQPHQQTRAEFLQAQYTSAILSACFHGKPIIWTDPLDGRKRVIPCDKQEIVVR